MWLTVVPLMTAAWDGAPATEDGRLGRRQTAPAPGGLPLPRVFTPIAAGVLKSGALRPKPAVPSAELEAPGTTTSVAWCAVPPFPPENMNGALMPMAAGGLPKILGAFAISALRLARRCGPVKPSSLIGPRSVFAPVSARGAIVAGGPAGAAPARLGSTPNPSWAETPK
jgi:hypothetical protein